MINFNTATVEGYVAHDPRIRETKNGKSLCTFAVAMNHYSEPDAPPKVSYIDIETWDKLADTCAKNITKGKRVMIHGKLRQDRWESKEGRVQSKLLVVGHEVRFLDSLKPEVPVEAQAAT